MRALALAVGLLVLGAGGLRADVLGGASDASPELREVLAVDPELLGSGTELADLFGDLPPGDPLIEQVAESEGGRVVVGEQATVEVGRGEGEADSRHEADSTTLPRFLPSAWFLLDLETKRLEEGADVGTHVRFWTLRSTVGGAEHVFGPLVGLRSLGAGWSWRFRDGSFMLGAGAVVETEALFDPEKELRVRPAVTLSLRRDGGEEE